VSSPCAHYSARAQSSLDHCRDMHARVALWCSLLGLGWPLPARELLTKAELIEEERIQQDMLEAWKHAAVEDLQIPSRSARVLVGFKSMTET
jgi:hypothetical protein